MKQLISHGAAVTKRSVISRPSRDAIVNAIYDCALDPGRWPDLLAMLANAANGHAAVLDVLETSASSGSVLIEHNTDPSWSEKYRQYYASLNPTRNYVERIKPFQPFTFDTLMGWDDFAKTPYHNEYRVPQGFGDCLTIMLEKNAGRTVYISIFKPDRDPLYTKSEINLVASVTPHIRRAVEIGKVLGERKIERDSLAQALNRLTFGVVLLDAEGHTAFLNAAAEDISTLGFFNVDRGRELRFVNAADAAWLRTTLAQRFGLIAPRMLEMKDRPRVLINAFALAPEIGANASPRIFELIGRASCLLAFHRQDAAMGDIGEAFGRLHGLTSAERRVFKALLDGFTPREAGQSLGISQPTVRTHLSHIFAKTDTRRQSELVRLASNLQTTLK